MHVYSNGSYIHCMVNWIKRTYSIRRTCGSRTSHKTHRFYNNTTVLLATNLSWFNRRASSNKHAYTRLIKQFKHYFLTWKIKALCDYSREYGRCLWTITAAIFCILECFKNAAHIIRDSPSKLDSTPYLDFSDWNQLACSCSENRRSLGPLITYEHLSEQ